MPNRLLAAVVVLSACVPRVAVAQPSSDWFYTQAGGLVGAAALFGLVRASSAACDIGCENDMPVGAEVYVAGVGAGIGVLAGLAVDRLRGDGEPAVAFQAGPILGRMTMRSPEFIGAADGAGATAAVQLSRFISVHAEYVSVNQTFMANPASIDPVVLANLVPAQSRAAGWARGVERSNLRWIFSELIGVHPPPWGRVRLELVGGLAVQASETFSYYDAEPGRYKVLNFAAPDLGAVVGGNVEMTVARHVVLVPMIRYYSGSDPGPSITYAIGALYRF